MASSLDASKPDEIRAALAELLLRPDPALVPLLSKLLAHPLALVRSGALDVLAASGACDEIVRALADREPTIRLKAVGRLASHAPGLGRALKNPDPDVREAAFRAVLSGALERRPQLLMIALGDRDPRRRRQALEALCVPRADGWREALDRALRDDHPIVSEAAAAFFARVSCAELVEAIGDPAARALLRRRGEEALPALAPAIVRSGAAMDLLFEIAPAKAPAMALAVWADLAPSARARALDRLVPLHGDPDPLLRTCAEDPDDSVRRVAARWLLRRGRWPALPPERWIALLSTRVGEDGWTEGDLARIVRGLGEGTEGTPALVEAAKGPYVLVRRAAAEILRRRGAFEALAELVETDDPGVLREVAIPLGERGDPRGLVPLVRATVECRGASARRAQELLARYPESSTSDFLLRALRHRRGSLRLYGAERLERSSDERAIAPLLGLTADASVEIQFAAVRALGKFAGRPEVTARFAEILEYGDLSVRQVAIEALGEARVASAVPGLVRLLANPFLKTRVMEALKRIGDRRGHLAVLRRRRRDEMIARQKELVASANRRR